MELVTLAKKIIQFKKRNLKWGLRNRNHSFVMKVNMVIGFCILLFLLTTSSQIVFAQNNVGIGCTDPDASAILELRSTSLGFLAPRMTLAQRPATPVTGLLIYQTDNTPGFYFYDGAAWVYMLAGSYWSLSGNSTTNPVNDFIGTTDLQDLVFRTNNLEKMRILSGGNVGIGLNNPTQKFEVYDGNILLSNSVAASELRFAEPGGADYTAFKAQSQIGNVTYTLPGADGSIGQVLTTDGAGLLSWSTISGGGSGWTVGAGVVYNTTDNIGIGTSTPGQKLELFDGNILLSNSASATELRFAEPGGIDYTAFKAQAQTANVTYTLPSADGTIGQVLTTDGAGLLSWSSPSGSVPLGTSGQTLRYDATNALIANSFLTNDGVQVAINDNNSGNQNPPLLIVQSGTGDASQRYFLSGGQSVSTGINNLDNDNYEISNTTALASTGAYTDANKMLRVHTEAGSIGIVDFNHQSRIRAYLNAVASIPTNLWTTIPFANESYDSQNEFNTATFEFTALEDGYYQVNARTEFDLIGAMANDSYLTIAIYVNGVIYSEGNNLQVVDNIGDVSSNNNAPNVSDVVQLTAGQIITIRVFQNTGNTYDIKAGSSKTYVSIHKLS
ncbi:MAG: hypothetical protein HZB41_06040 [Ignavibacteriae bacterium]|nr:hypothetical protein [Ignavibacteriota bacterium]